MTFYSNGSKCTSVSPFSFLGYILKWAQIHSKWSTESLISQFVWMSRSFSRKLCSDRTWTLSLVKLTGISNLCKKKNNVESCRILMLMLCVSPSCSAQKSIKHVSTVSTSTAAPFVAMSLNQRAAEEENEWENIPTSEAADEKARPRPSGDVLGPRAGHLSLVQEVTWWLFPSKSR